MQRSGGTPIGARTQQKTNVYCVIAGLGGQEVTYDDSADFLWKRCMGEEYWFGVNDQV